MHLFWTYSLPIFHWWREETEVFAALALIYLMLKRQPNVKYSADMFIPGPFFWQGSLKESIQGTHPLPNHKKGGMKKKTTRRRAEHRKRPTQATDGGNRQNQQNNQATSFPTPNYTKKHKTTLKPRNRILHAMKWFSVWFSPDHQREWWGILSKQCLSVCDLESNDYGLWD